MKKQIFLNQFEYAIPVSALEVTRITGKYMVAEHLPLMKVVIDFENGNLKLEGDWNFMMAANRHNEASWFRHHRERVKIEMAVYPAGSINLDDEETNGIMCPLQGNIKDGSSVGECTGLLVIDKAYGKNNPVGNQWNISFYIYDTVFDDCEIKFKLPVYIPGINSKFN